VEEIDDRTACSLDKSAIRSLTQQSTWVGTHENIFVLGPTGVETDRRGVSARAHPPGKMLSHADSTRPAIRKMACNESTNNLFLPLANGPLLCFGARKGHSKPIAAASAAITSGFLQTPSSKVPRPVPYPAPPTNSPRVTSDKVLAFMVNFSCDLLRLTAEARISIHAKNTV